MNKIFTYHPCLCAAVVMAVAVSCAKDLGNYNYTDLNGPSISGIPETLDVLTMQTLAISPVIEGGLPEDSYTYELKAIDRNNDNTVTEIGTEKDLRYRVALSPGAYSLYYTMTERESGIMWQTTSSLTVSSSMSEGWMVLCSD